MDRMFVIEIKKDEKIIANLQKKGNCFKTEMLSFVMVWIEDILYNYNLNLSTSRLDNIPLAIRILQEENEEGDREYDKAVVCYDTIDFLERNFGRFDIYGPLTISIYTSTDIGIIAAIETDIKRNRKGADMNVIIDLDNACINFNCKFKKVKLSDWVDEEIGKIKDNLQVCPYDFKMLPFNELKDAYNFVIENESGWLESAKGRSVTIFS